MTLTVNIMSYKYGHLAAQCIESVLEQTIKPDAIRFFDDGAGDCTHLAYIYPDIEYVLRKGNVGIISNFNDALDKTETDRVIFIGADNYFVPDAIESILRFEDDIVSYDLLICGEDREAFSKGWNIKENTLGFPVWKFTKGNIHRANYIHGSSMYNVKLAKSVGGYYRDKGPRSNEDWMLFREMLNAGASHFHIPESLMVYRRHRLNYNRGK